MYTEKTKRSGFCVICERGFAFIRSHMNTSHLNVFSSTKKNCYAICLYGGRRLMVPRGVFFKKELSECETCPGVFYRHRLRNHECGNPRNLIDEGLGLKFCLMCQLHCDDLDDHWTDAHGRNEIYEILEVKGIRTLLPKQTNLMVDLEYFKPCSCGACLQLKYKGRIKRACGKD
ncbi:Hypothetical predicted protein [Cloeon dipterum]|uniref:Uncharacterized protein n=1 Tax=Cloeon dipterum TaxID=197152 RepID=A0A8S1DJ95_9INSE|nr:Hypothetical predicted protein [Cloeon dipterum]